MSDSVVHIAPEVVQKMTLKKSEILFLRTTGVSDGEYFGLVRWQTTATQLWQICNSRYVN